MLLHNVPRSLVEQKKAYDVDTLFAMSKLYPNGFVTFLIEEDEKPISVVWCSPDTIYRQIYVDTFIVDRDHRDEETVRACVQIGTQAIRAFARELGMKKMVVSANSFLMRRIARFSGLKFKNTRQVVMTYEEE